MGPPPIPTAKRLRIAAKVAGLPAELIEPILVDLPLHIMLDLSVAVSKLSPTSASNLQWALEHSPSWGWVFDGWTGRLQALWKALNHLSWVWCDQPWKEMAPKSFKDTLMQPAQGLMKRHDYYQGHVAASHRVHWQLTYHFMVALTRFLGTERWSDWTHEGYRDFVGASQQQRQAIFLFLPEYLLTRMREMNDNGQNPSGPFPSPREDSVLNYRDYLSRAAKDPGWDCSMTVSLHDFVSERCLTFMPYLVSAHQLLHEAMAAELAFLADLYRRHPRLLKQPRAPQTLRKNTYHILETLRRDADRALTRSTRRFRGTDRSAAASWSKTGLPPRRGKEWYHFRYPHPSLVPYDWCLQLFKAVLDQNPQLPIQCPPEIALDLKRAIDGLDFVYNYAHSPIRPSTARQRRWAGRSGNTTYITASDAEVSHVMFLDDNSALPSPLAELVWLESFVKCVAWMEKEFAGLALMIRGLPEKSLYLGGKE